MTLGEVLLWNELKSKQMLGFDFDRQKPIDNYIVDFYCKELMLAIEIDGSSHDEEEIVLNDEVRQGKLESLGVIFLRYSENEVRNDIKFVLNDIYNWIADNK